MESSKLLAMIVPLNPLLRSRVAWGRRMWDCVTLLLLFSFRLPATRLVLPFLIAVFSYEVKIMTQSTL